jgi:hypothetical protein
MAANTGTNFYVNDDPTVLYTLYPNGLVTWEHLGNFQSTKYPMVIAQKHIDRGTWVIVVGDK